MESRKTGNLPGRRSCAERCQRMSVCAGWGTKAPGSSHELPEMEQQQVPKHQGLLELAVVSDPTDGEDKGQEATHSP